MHTKRKAAHQSRSSRSTSAHRDTWSKAPSYDNAPPEEFFDSRIKLASVSPETALMYAVLEDAFFCFHNRFGAEQRLLQRAREAEKWFFRDDFRGLFSFLSICDALGMAPQYIRKKLKH